MQELKRVGWRIGQPLLPMHLTAQEESLLAHIDFYAKNQSFPFYGFVNLKWDEDTLFRRGVLLIHTCTVVFPTGEIINVPENGAIEQYNLRETKLKRLTIYLHLLKDSIEKESILETIEDEKIIFSVNQLMLSKENHTNSTKAVIKLAEFEENSEGHWTLLNSYIPPLISINSNPFFGSIIAQFRILIEGFQKELEQEINTGKMFAQRTMETKICLCQVAKIRRFILNIDRQVMAHPYFLYEQISEFLDILALIFANQADFSIIPYQHEKLASLFNKLTEALLKYLKPQSEQLSFIRFEAREDRYVSEKLPQELKDADNCYFIVQHIDATVKAAIDGLKLASYSRLENIHRFALTGIPLLRLESVPFNNTLSKYAYVYSVEKTIEWEYALTEQRLAFRVDKGTQLQAFLYWR